MTYCDFVDTWKNYNKLEQSIIKYINEKYLKPLNARGLSGCRSVYYIQNFNIDCELDKVYTQIKDAIDPNAKSIAYEFTIEEFLDWVNRIE